MDPLVALENRLYYTPITRYGALVDQPTQPITAIYDGTLLPSFVYQNGGDYTNYRGFLEDNRIGSVFDDLEEGQQVIVAQDNVSSQFSAHPEA